jgi:hypothetical protein
MPLKKFEVWMEGYAATGEREAAYKAGEVEARNFQEACHVLMCKQYLEYIKKDWTKPGRWDYDPKNLTYWSRQLYDNETDARKNFG